MNRIDLQLRFRRRTRGVKGRRVSRHLTHRLSNSRDSMITYRPIVVSTTALTESQQSYSYDPADRLIQAQGVARQESYTLDPASNLTNQNIGSSGKDAWNWQGQPNVNNQLAKTQQGFAGYSPEQFTPVYDADGQLTEDADNLYQWDAAGNLVTITNKATGHVTNMAYDGLKRRVRIEERDGTNSTVSNYLWCGSQICQKLDASNDIIAEYFDQGEIHADLGGNLNASNSGTVLLYERDRLGSIRGTVAPNGAQQGSTSYTAYGQTDRSSGVQADKGYAGMFLHQPSGLYLTWYRAYDPVTGRWLSRDPIKEQGGINLYGYVDGNPINDTDRDGLSVNAINQNSPNNGGENLCQNTSKHEECVAKYLRFLPSPSGDLQSSEYRKCYRECMGSL
jgi:RHS repeat-associated protein